MKKIISVLVFLILIFQTASAEEIVNTYSENNKFGLIKGENKTTKAEYSKLIRLRDSSWIFLKKNKYGIIDNDGNILVEPKYTSAHRFIGKYAKLGYGGLYCIYDENGNLIIDREYSSIEILFGRMFLVGKNFKFGLISFDGDIILAPVADDIYMPKPNILRILYDGNWIEIEHIGSDTMEIPNDILIGDDNFKITQLVQNPVIGAGYGVVTFSDYFIKLFSSISPAYEQTIDQLILEHGADTASILIKFSWLAKFPFVYGKNYFKIVVSPNSGPLTDIKSNIKNKLISE